MISSSVKRLFVWVGWQGRSAMPSTYFMDNDDYPRYPAEIMVMGEWLTLWPTR